jgi:trehalose synthase-fused probable maltokinase
LSGLPFVEASREEPPATFAELAGEYPEAIRTLGRRTAELHLALAEGSRNRDFKPEKATRSFVERMSEAISQEVRETLALLSSKISDFPADIRKYADLILLEGPTLLGKIQSLPEIGDDLGTLIRIHGDYHLGQVLRSNVGDFIILDFEGEPLRPLAERRRKSSPLKDVAGMIRSLHYAAHAPLPRENDIPDNSPLKPWREAWYEWTCAIFLNGYLDTASGAAFLPATGLEVLLDFFLLEKVFYELRYELNNRPDWVHIPLAGIVDIINRQKTGRRKQ